MNQVRVYVGDTGKNQSEGILSALDSVGLLNQRHRTPKIFVKPNLTFPRHIPGVTSSPGFLRDILRVLKETGFEVFVGESNGGYGSFLAAEAFEGHGLIEMCRETRSELVNLSELDSKDYSATIDGKSTWVRLPRFLVEDAALTLSVPVLKVHAMTTVSLSVKNLWGCCPTDLRLLQHAELDRKLRLIADLVKARYGIVDGTYGLDGHGPMEGDPREIGKFVAGDDLYGLDWVVTRMMGLNPNVIHHLRLISQSSLDSIRAGNIATNRDLSQINWHFRIGLNVVDAFSLACFHSDLLAKVVFDSPFTRPIYWLFGREPRRRLT